MEKIVGISASRSLPEWRSDAFKAPAAPVSAEAGREVVLWADTFNAAFERENLDAALAVLTGAGYRVHFAKAQDGSTRPLCCGRTFLSVGNVAAARAEMERSLEVACALSIARGSDRRIGAELPFDLPRRGHRRPSGL